MNRSRRNMLASGLATCAVALDVASASEGTVSSESNLSTWLKASAHPIGLDSAAGVALAIREARVVGIGEGTHGTHEDFSFKAAIILELARDGSLGTLAFEASRRAGAALDAFVLGQGSSTSALDAMRQGLYRMWHCVEVVELLNELRKINKSKSARVRIVGIDVQDFTNDASAALSAAYKLGILDTRAERAVGRIIQSSHPQAAARNMGLEEIRDVRSALSDLSVRLRSRQDSDEFSYKGHLISLAALHGFEYAIAAASRVLKDNDPIAVRDRGMAEIVLALSGRQKVALWAHNAHVDRETPIGPGASPMGEHLSNSLGADYAVVKFAWSDGCVHARDARAHLSNDLAQSGFRRFRVRNDRPGSIGRLLLDARLDRCWIDLRSLPEAEWAREFLTLPMSWGSVGMTFDERSWHLSGSHPKWPIGRSTDVLVYFPVVTPSQILLG